MSDVWTRRRWLKTVAAGTAGVISSRFAFAQAAEAPPLSLELFNTHTGETVSTVFRDGAGYHAAGVGELRRLLRDHRNDELHDIDVRLYDQLHALAQSAGREPRFEVISGYRSPASNSKMAARPGSGVAKHSLHMEGRAIDVRLRECDCAHLSELALAARRGGVGYYRASDFVHIDTGSFRTWNG